MLLLHNNNMRDCQAWHEGMFNQSSIFYGRHPLFQPQRAKFCAKLSSTLLYIFKYFTIIRFFQCGHQLEMFVCFYFFTFNNFVKNFCCWSDIDLMEWLFYYWVLLSVFKCIYYSTMQTNSRGNFIDFVQCSK